MEEAEEADIGAVEGAVVEGSAVGGGAVAGGDGLGWDGAGAGGLLEAISSSVRSVSSI